MRSRRSRLLSCRPRLRSYARPARTARGHSGCWIACARPTACATAVGDEKSYIGWIRRFILFHGKRHPAEMGAPEVVQFLSSLAVEGRVAASTQNQALSALLFLYRYVLQQELPWLEEVVRARRPKHLPIVLTRDEVRAVISKLEGRHASWPLCSTAPGCACSNGPA